MEMMEAQLKRWKDTAQDALYLREQAQSLRVSLSNKADEQKGLEDKCAKQMAEIKSLKALVSFLYVPKTIYSKKICVVITMFFCSIYMPLSNRFLGTLTHPRT
jgi:hypothetical protein